MRAVVEPNSGFFRRGDGDQRGRYLSSSVWTTRPAKSASRKTGRWSHIARAFSSIPALTPETVPPRRRWHSRSRHIYVRTVVSSMIIMGLPSGLASGAPEP